MRVLFQSRDDLHTTCAGDTVIARQLRAALLRRSVSAVIDNDPEANLSGFDLVHLFNVAHRDCYARALNARRQGRPIVVSTIYWNQDELLRPGSPERSDYRESRRKRWRRRRWELVERLGAASPAMSERRRRKARYYALGSHGMAHAVIEMADSLLPGSQREHELLLRQFPAVRAKPLRLVPHGIDPAFFPAAVPERSNRFLTQQRLRDFLLCVGRVERRKNQLGLLEAARDLPLPVLLIGSNVDRGYAAQVQARLRPQDRWLAYWPHERLHEVYALARVHALPSFNDTPGLASLEAGAMGVPLVVGNRGSERDYFGERVDYCDPADPQDIRRALLAALARPQPAGELAQHVRGSFTWERSADEVLAAYRGILR